MGNALSTYEERLQYLESQAPVGAVNKVNSTTNDQSLVRRYVEGKERSISPWFGSRGMDPQHDLLDWFGGWPLEFHRADDLRKLMETLRCFREESFLEYGERCCANVYIFRRCDGYCE